MSVISRPRNKFEARLQVRADKAISSMEVWGKRLVVFIIAVWMASFLIGFQAALTILVFLGFASAILAWRSPALALFGISILFALDSLTRVYLLSGGLLRWNTLNYWIALVIVLSVPFLLRLKDPHTRLFEVFLFLLVVELLISPRLSEGLQDILNLLSLFGLYVYLSRVLKEEVPFYWLGIVIGVLAAVGNLPFYLLRDSLPYINPNAQAVFPLTGLYAILLAVPSARNYHRGRLFLTLLAIVNALWIFLSGSRGNIVVGALCLLFLLFLTRSLSWTVIFISLGLLIGSYVSYTFLEDQLYAQSRLQRLFDPNYTLAERTSGRSDLAEAGWLIFQEHPFGVGTGGFRTYAGQLEFLEFAARPAHTAWMKTLAENGFPGFILLAAYVVSFVYIGMKKKDYDLRVLGLLVTIAIIMVYVSSEFANKGVIFLAAGATVLMHKDEFRENILLGGRFKGRQRWRLREKTSFHGNKHGHSS